MAPVVRICRTQGCSTLTDGTFYCAEHSRRDGRTSRNWYRFSREIIARANGKCQLAYAGCTITASHAHRIGKGHHDLDPAMYQAACKHCHQLLHTGYGDPVNP